MSSTQSPSSFTLPPISAGESHTLVAGTTRKGKSLMPDHSELTMGLAERAFQLIGKPDFKVDACLAVENTKSLRNFGLLESILLMAYQQGARDALAGTIPAEANIAAFTRASVSEAEALLGNASLRVVTAPRP